eukprot:760874-Hanusia_phi.AAC.3
MTLSYPVASFKFGYNKGVDGGSRGVGFRRLTIAILMYSGLPRIPPVSQRCPTHPSCRINPWSNAGLQDPTPLSNPLYRTRTLRRFPGTSVPSRNRLSADTRVHRNGVTTHAYIEKESFRHEGEVLVVKEAPKNVEKKCFRKFQGVSTRSSQKYLVPLPKAGIQPTLQHNLPHA